MPNGKRSLQSDMILQEGNISGARAMNMEKSELAKITLKAILKGPKWIPATINGIAVKSIRNQKISFKTKSNLN